MSLIRSPRLLVHYGCGAFGPKPLLAMGVLASVLGFDQLIAGRRTGVLHRALGGVLEHLPLGINSPPHVGADTIDSVERNMILDALARAGGNKSKAARLLGLTRGQLRSRIEKHGLTVGS